MNSAPFLSHFGPRNLQSLNSKFCVLVACIRRDVAPSSSRQVIPNVQTLADYTKAMMTSSTSHAKCSQSAFQKHMLDNLSSIIIEASNSINPLLRTGASEPMRTINLDDAQLRLTNVDIFRCLSAAHAQ